MTEYTHSVKLTSCSVLRLVLNVSHLYAELLRSCQQLEVMLCQGRAHQQVPLLYAPSYVTDCGTHYSFDALITITYRRNSMLLCAVLLPVN